MVTIDMLKDSAGDLIGFDAKGHSGYEERGRDIVCAAVSVLTLTTAKGLIEHVGLNPTIQQGPGRLLCRIDNYAELPKEMRHNASLLLKTMLTGLEQIVCQYPDFVRLN
ncbi:MAG: ribosomal-processing cysteine protease Prp [Limnochordia bacterium]|jgi:uncharacterized protein YsxB (DUF464 family)|nr:ribosomal-processing cysteine protease Prp [Limnochordia bacterium]MDD4518237.1 ribosomal-processing cysteine protease Prp [Limnochordia bacterium]